MIRRVSSQDKFFRWIKQADKWGAWYNKAKVERYYYEGVQWTAEEVAKLESSGQPAITVNHIWSRINTLVGLLLQQKPQINLYPRGKDDVGLASIGTKIIRYILEINRFGRKIAEAFTDMASVGLGWIDVHITGELTKDPIIIEYVPWKNVIFDMKAEQPDLSDMRYVIRWRWVDRDTFMEFFPRTKKLFKDNLVVAGGIGYNIPGIEVQWFDKEESRVLVLEFQYKVFEERPCYWDGVQAVKYRPKLHDRLVRKGVGRVIKARIPVIRKAIIVGDWLVEDEELPYIHGYFTLVPFIAYRDLDGRPIGVVRQLKDMQDEVNKRRSKVLHYLTAKRVLAEEGAIDDPDEFMDELMRPDAFLTYRKGYNVSIEQDLQLGAQHYELMKDAAQEMSVISGIFPDFFGMPTNARNAAAIRQRVIQSQTTIQKFYSVLEDGMTRVAEICLALAKQYYTEERLIQLSDDPEAILINEAITDPDTGVLDVRNSIAEIRGDVVVKIEAGGYTKRQEQLSQLIELIKVLPPQLTAVSLDVVLDAFDLPQKNELKRRLAMLMQAQQEQQNISQNSSQGMEEASTEA